MKKIVAILIALCSIFMASAHASLALHCQDFYAVLPFEKSPKIDKWFKCISSGMIDNYKGEPQAKYGGLNFYDYLKKEFPPFACKHRLLFHWGYNTAPWSASLQKKVNGYRWSSAKIDRFKETLRQEQQDRNRKANAMTESLFGFASGGSEAAWANAMISIVYDVHIIGDYMPDNRDFAGVQDLSSAVGDLINAIRKLDSDSSSDIINKIKKASNRTDLHFTIRSKLIMEVLSQNLPQFIRNAQGGMFVRRFAKRGIKIK